MSDKTTNWTPEELAEFAKQRARSNADAWERTPDGRILMYGHGKQYAWEGHICPEYEHCSLCVDEARDCTAAIVGGFIGMGIEIHERWWKFEPCTCTVLDYSAPPMHVAGCPHASREVLP